MSHTAVGTFEKKFSYHHGNLREALISAGLSILENDGIAALSLRQLARATGVSQAAPYSHFRDKDDLLAKLAEAGFQRLAIQMATDGKGAVSTEDRIVRLVSSYVLFARDNRALFSLMFGREIADMKKYPTLAMTAGKSYSLFSTALSQRTSYDVDTRFLTVAVWSLCHGLATLIVDNRVDVAQFGATDVTDFIAKNVAVFSQHLS